jgi:phage gpG-like protein
MTDGAFIKIDGFEELTRQLDDLGEFASRPNEAALIGARVIAQQSGEAFMAGADPVTGSPWPSLSPATIKGRRGGGGGAKPLRDTQALLQAVLNMDVSITSGDSATVGVSGGRTENGSITLGELASIHNGSPTAASQDDVIIRPVKADKLTIPVSPLARKFGSVAEFRSRNRSLKPFWKGKTMVAKDRRGNLVTHWVLTDEVRIPRRRFMGLWDKGVDEILNTIIQEIEALNQLKAV